MYLYGYEALNAILTCNSEIIKVLERCYECSLKVNNEIFRKILFKKVVELEHFELLKKMKTCKYYFNETIKKFIYPLKKDACIFCISNEEWKDAFILKKTKFLTEKDINAKFTSSENPQHLKILFYNFSNIIDKDSLIYGLCNHSTCLNLYQNVVPSLQMNILYGLFISNCNMNIMTTNVFKYMIAEIQKRVVSPIDCEFFQIEIGTCLCKVLENQNYNFAKILFKYKPIVHKDDILLFCNFKHLNALDIMLNNNIKFNFKHICTFIVSVNNDCINLPLKSHHFINRLYKNSTYNPHIL